MSEKISVGVQINMKEKKIDIKEIESLGEYGVNVIDFFVDQMKKTMKELEEKEKEIAKKSEKISEEQLLNLSQKKELEELQLKHKNDLAEYRKDKENIEAINKNKNFDKEREIEKLNREIENLKIEKEKKDEEYSNSFREKISEIGDLKKKLKASEESNQEKIKEIENLKEKSKENADLLLKELIDEFMKSKKILEKLAEGIKDENKVPEKESKQDKMLEEKNPTEHES